MTRERVKGCRQRMRLAQGWLRTGLGRGRCLHERLDGLGGDGSIYCRLLQTQVCANPTLGQAIKPSVIGVFITQTEIDTRGRVPGVSLGKRDSRFSNTWREKREF